MQPSWWFLIWVLSLSAGALSCEPSPAPVPVVPEPAERAVTALPVPTRPIRDKFSVPEALETLPSGLKTAVEVPGVGVRARPGQVVTVHFTQWLSDGTLLDSSKTRTPPTPASFVLGEGLVTAGWDEGIALMRVGEARWLVIPPELGYGNLDLGKIPPGSTLVARIELYAVK